MQKGCGYWKRGSVEVWDNKKKMKRMECESEFVAIESAE